MTANGQEVSRLVAAVRRYRLLVAFLVVAGVAAAVGFSYTVDVRYRSVTSVALEETAPDVNVTARIDERRERILEALGGLTRGVNLTLRARPAQPRVLIVAESTSSSRSQQAAAQAAAELVASERRIDREALATLISRAEDRVDRLEASDTERAGRALPGAERQLDALRDRQISDADFPPVSTAEYDGPKPLRNGLLMLPVALLIALATVRLLALLDDRTKAAGRVGARDAT